MGILMLVLAVVGGGVGLILMARWARRRNNSMGSVSAWSANRGKVSLPQIFFGSRTSVESGLGQTLAVLVIVAVLAFLTLAAYALFINP